MNSEANTATESGTVAAIEPVTTQRQLLSRFQDTLEHLREGLNGDGPSAEQQALVEQTLKTFQQTVDSLKGQTHLIESKLKDFQRQFLVDHFSCEICGQVLYQPITLFCQHTFCRVCLITYLKKQVETHNGGGAAGTAFGGMGGVNNGGIVGGGGAGGPIINLDPINYNYSSTTLSTKCPKCQRKFVLPPKAEQLNYHMDGAINDLSRQTGDDPAQEKRKKDALKLELMDQVKIELRQELLDTVLGETAVANNPYQFAGTTTTSTNFGNIPTYSYSLSNTGGLTSTSSSNYPLGISTTYSSEWSEADIRKWMMRFAIGACGVGIVASTLRMFCDVKFLWGK